MADPRPGPERGWLARRVRALGCAWVGVVLLVRGEEHARVHLLATAGVIALGVITGLERWEWSAVLLAVGLVWVAEALNAAVERVCDAVTDQPDKRIRAAKDLAAGGVLLASLTALAVAAAVWVLPAVD